MQSMRSVFSSVILCGVLMTPAAIQAQPGWLIPAANSPQAMMGLMRFHVSIAHTIRAKSLSPDRDLQDVARNTFGISFAEFQALTEEYNTILGNYQNNVKGQAGPMGAEAVLMSEFSELLAHLPVAGSTKITAFMNGPLRSGMRVKSIRKEGANK